VEDGSCLKPLENKGLRSLPRAVGEKQGSYRASGRVFVAQDLQHHGVAARERLPAGQNVQKCLVAKEHETLLGSDCDFTIPALAHELRRPSSLWGQPREHWTRLRRWEWPLRCPTPLVSSAELRHPEVLVKEAPAFRGGSRTRPRLDRAVLLIPTTHGGTLIPCRAEVTGVAEVDRPATGNGMMTRNAPAARSPPPSSAFPRKRRNGSGGSCRRPCRTIIGPE
jgi:hypothetical protein